MLILPFHLPATFWFYCCYVCLLSKLVLNVQNAPALMIPLSEFGFHSRPRTNTKKKFLLDSADHIRFFPVFIFILCGSKESRLWKSGRICIKSPEIYSKNLLSLTFEKIWTVFCFLNWCTYETSLSLSKFSTKPHRREYRD